MKTVFEGTYAELQKQIASLPIEQQVRVSVTLIYCAPPTATAPVTTTAAPIDAAVAREAVERLRRAALVPARSFCAAS